MVTAQLVADYVLWSAHESESFISNLKLQKLLYYIQSWHLAINHAPLFPEKFEAWVHGPALPDIYRKYKVYSWKNIDEKVECPNLAPDVKSFVEEVLDEYGHLDARKLEYLTHRETPWIMARAGLAEDELCSAKIDERLMESYYGARLAEERVEQVEDFITQQDLKEAAAHEAELLGNENDE